MRVVPRKDRNDGNQWIGISHIQAVSSLGKDISTVLEWRIDGAIRRYERALHATVVETIISRSEVSTTYT